MKLETVDLANGVTKISLAGRLDIQGALKVDGEFAAIEEEYRRGSFRGDLPCFPGDPHADRRGEGGGEQRRKAGSIESPAERRKRAEEQQRGYGDADHQRRDASRDGVWRLNAFLVADGRDWLAPRFQRLHRGCHGRVGLGRADRGESETSGEIDVRHAGLSRGTHVEHRAAWKGSFVSDRDGRG